MDDDVVVAVVELFVVLEFVKRVDSLTTDRDPELMGLGLNITGDDSILVEARKVAKLLLKSWGERLYVHNLLFVDVEFSSGVDLMTSEDMKVDLLRLESPRFDAPGRDEMVDDDDDDEVIVSKIDGSTIVVKVDCRSTAVSALLPNKPTPSLGTRTLRGLGLRRIPKIGFARSSSSSEPALLFSPPLLSSGSRFVADAARDASIFSSKRPSKSESGI